MRNVVLLRTCDLRLTFFFVFDFFIFGKNFSIIYLYEQTSQIDCFRRVHKILKMNRL